jgi:putative glutamine amidotransferase
LCGVNPVSLTASTFKEHRKDRFQGIIIGGGSLFGDIRSLRMKTFCRRNPLPYKCANLVSEGRLVHIFRQSHWWINSLHSQAIDDLGDGLKIVVRDDDQFVQAAESTDHRFIIGVQWHPEYLFYLGHQCRIFRVLVDAAKGLPAEVVH